ncbi:ribosomal protein L1p/L10e family-domain-containing protein [Lentinula raphanica]|nr:ribosomal protein L1p/L10e family-domain-containing protein [Lentinula raphanica]
MAKDELIDDRVSLNQCQKAVDALHAYVSEVAAKKAETQLLPDVEQAFWLTIALKKQPQGSSLKVYSIPIAHPIVDPRKESVCLFTKDPQRTYKDLLADNNIRFISKVIDISKLKGKYKAFDARRALLKEHGLFLADDRVIPLLPKLLGSKFFQAKKQPLPVNITRKNLKTELERAVSSTYMPSIRGSTLSVRVGKISQTAAQVVANIKTALPVIASKINGGWDNVQSIGLKTSMSAYLPIWTCSLDDSKDGRWASLAADDEEESDFEGDEDEEDDEDEEEEDEEEDGVDDVEDVGMIGDDEESDSSGIVQKIKATGKKRAADLDGDNDADETPKKKKKSKKSSDVFKAVDEPPKSQKSKSIASAPAKQKSAPVSTTEDASTSKVTGPKTLSEYNLPATKKAPTPAEKPSTKQKSAKTTDIKDTTQPPDSSAPKKQKGEKEKKSATATTSKSISEITSTPAESVPAPAKKTKKSDAAAPEAASPTATSASTTKKTTEKKAKKDGSAVVAAEEKSASKKEKKKKDLASPEDVPQEISTVDSDEKSKKKKEKKSKSSDADDGMAAVVVAEEEHSKEKKKQKKEKKASDANAATLEGDDAMDIDAEHVSDKKAKKTKVAQEEGSTAYSLSNDDLKQKKSKAPGEKKKSKVVKSDSKGKKKWVIPGLF